MRPGCSPSRAARRRRGRKRTGMPKMRGTMRATDPPRTIRIRIKDPPARRGRRKTARPRRRKGEIARSGMAAR